MPVTKAQLLNSIGVSTFNNGPVLIGSATSTGTATQRLQVTGGAYVSGDVGIGITIPDTSSTLHVFTGNSTKGIRVQRFSGSYYSDIIHTDLPEGLAFRIGDGSNVQERLRITGTGFVGINTSNPQNPLQVGSGSNIVLVDSSGDLGIGTAAATSKLQVVGDARISGVVTAASFVGSGIGLTGINAGTSLSMTIALS